MLLLLRRALKGDMPWFNVDDSFYDHPKVFDAPDCAVALWSRAGSWSSRNLTDGFVPAKMPARLCDDPGAAVRELLDRGLWQRARGGYQFHDWTDWNRSKDAIKAKRAFNARRQALARDPALKEAVRVRDGDQCRYCGRVVHWGKGQAADSGTYDHVDPDGSNDEGNIVVACRRCNSAKAGRTPDEAGMPLLAPPGSDASRNASHNPSRNASRNGSVEVSQSNPIQSVVDVVSHLAGSYAHELDDDDLLKKIIDSIHQRTGHVVTADQARSVASGILASARQRPGNLAAYLQRSILDERDPHGRFLPPRPPPEPEPAVPWCGKCDERTRLRELDGGAPARCPDCHPLTRKEAS